MASPVLGTPAHSQEDPGSSRIPRSASGQERNPPVSQKGKRVNSGGCLPRTSSIPSIQIRSAAVREKIGAWKEKALIGKFVGIWPKEKDLIKWINGVWKPKGHYDLQLGSKGFFTIIFFNQEDRDRIMEGGPYFFFSAGLFLRPWKERFNPETEDMTVAPVWIRLFSLPGEYWDLETLRDIGNSLGEFIKVAEQTRLQRYTAFARICVYMDLSRELPEAISLNWEDEEWIQPLDYEQLPFRCRLCHEYGHFGRNCPNASLRPNPAAPVSPPEAGTDGFTMVKNKRRGKGGGKILTRPDQSTPEIPQGNAFEVLASAEEKDGNQPQTQPSDPPPPPDPKDDQQMDGVEEDEGDDMELGELDLDAIEEECRKKDQGYVSRRQLELLQEAIIKSGAVECLGIDPDAPKGSKRKSPEEELRRGRKTNKQRIAAVGVRLIESGQYPTIQAAFSEAKKFCQ